MPQVTRVGDNTQGICNPGLPCCSHQRSGTNKEHSPNVYANNKAIHRVEDTGPCNCPHEGTFKSTKGSKTVFINGHPATRVGDITVCMSCGEQGTHVEGSQNVYIGG